MNQRPAQLASMIMSSVQERLTRGLGDPRLDGCMLTLTEVSVSPDLRHATLMVSVLPEKAQARAIAALAHAAAHLRRRVGEDLDRHNLPQFTFTLDTRLKKQSALLEALRRASEVTPPLTSPFPTEPTPDLPEDRRDARPGPGADPVQDSLLDSTRRSHADSRREPQS